MQCKLVKFQSCLLGRLRNFENLQVIIAFFSKTVRPRNMKFFLYRVSILVNIKKNVKFLCCTVSEKNAMLISRYHCIFLENCETDEHEIFLLRVSIWVNIQKTFQVPRSHSIREKCNANL